MKHNPNIPKTFNCVRLPLCYSRVRYGVPLMMASYSVEELMKLDRNLIDRSRAINTDVMAVHLVRVSDKLSPTVSVSTNSLIGRTCN